ncbi:MAG: hypothetical protein ACLP3C_09590 [Mycobacterium sp.]|uniref:hypothetical protein n=1 Tax=Mycobacterium sp. TaxID=1785 RepID=UPI003F9D6E73
MTTTVSFERRDHRVVDDYYARRITDEMDARGYLVTGPEAESEGRKQQRNGNVYFSSRYRQCAYYQRIW